MKRASLPLLIGLIALSGCARHYVIKLDSGAQITTSTKPKLNEDTYHFRDATGEEHLLPSFRVREIAPASMAERENKPQPLKARVQKKHKWYLLWLG